MRFAVFLIVLTLITPIPAAAEDARDLPVLLRSKDASRTYPLWVSAREAFDEFGGLKSSLFSEVDLRNLQRDFKLRPGVHSTDDGGAASPFWNLESKNCVRTWGAPIGDFEDTTDRVKVTSVAELARASQSIHAGRIVGMEWGFIGSEPGSLLEVEINSTLKGTAPRRLLLFFYYARFSTSAAQYCVGRVKPNIGARIVFFETSPPLDALGTLWNGAEHVIVEDGQGGVQFIGVPKANENELNSMDQILETVRVVVENEPLRREQDGRE